LFDLFARQVLRFEEVLFCELVELLCRFEPSMIKSLRLLVSFSGRDVCLLLWAGGRGADGCDRVSLGDDGNNKKRAKRQAH
jgi:hypothetical protein